MTDAQETTAPASQPTPRRLSRRLALVLTAAAALSVAEFVVMCALPRLGLHGVWEKVADSLLLAILVLPVLYVLAHRPGTLTTPQALRRYTRPEKRTLFTLLALVVVVTAAVIVQGLLMSEHESASRVTNVAERQRMLAQHLVEEAMFEAMELAHAQLLEREPRTSGAIAESSARFERGLRALVEGDTELGVPPCASDEVIRQLKEVEAAWRPLRALLGQTSQPSDMDEALIYYTRLHDAGDRLLAEVERTVTLLEKYYEGRRQRLSTVLAALILPAGLASALLMIAFVQMMHHRERLDAALRESEAKAHAIVDNAADGIITIRERGIVESFNATAEHMFGYAANEVIGRNVSVLMPSPHREEHDRHIQKYLDTEHKKMIGVTREVVGRRKDGSVFPIDIHVSEVRLGDRPMFTWIVRDITDRKRAEEQALRRAGVLDAINTVLREALVCETDKEVALTCLGVAEGLTGSKFGFIGEVNEAGRCDATALSDPGWDACRMPKSNALVVIKDMEIRGIWGRVLEDGESLIVNDPASHPERVGTPEGHPPLTSFLGVPLKLAGKSIGMIALANKEPGYSPADQEAVEALSVAFVEALMRKRAEGRLNETKQMLENITQGITDEVLLLSRDLRIIWANRAVLERSGRKTEDVVGDYCYAVTHHRSAPCQAPDDVCPVEEIVRTGKPVTVTHTHYDGTGDQYSVEVTAYPVKDKKGEIVQFVHVSRDVTEQKRSEEENRRLAQAVESAADAIVLTDKAGRITRVNPAFIRITGYTAEEAVGQTPRVLKSGKHPRELYEAMWKRLTAGQGWSGRLFNKRKDGSTYYAALTISPISDERGEVIGYVGVQRDVTEDVEREERLHEYAKALEAGTDALKQATAQATAAAQAKSEFLANMSHEIRTPMTAILGFAETLLDPELSESDRLNAINIIRRNGEYLVRVINDILDLSKIEAGRLEVERVRCSPVQVAAEVQSLMQVRADAKKLPFHIEYIGPIPETIETDPGRLRQVLINLVGNAIKFTDEGAVRLVVRMRNAECGMRSKRVAVAGTATPRQHRQDAGATTDIPPSPMIQFDVIDTGVGITAEQMPKLFQAFSQADTSTTRKYGGTGLGLTISKRLAQALGGDITVDSKPGEGSTFRVTVATGPLDGVRLIDDPSEAALGACGAAGFSPRGAARDEPRGSGEAKLDCRILLAEDGPDNQRLISFVLRKAGAEVTLAENGQLAVDAALAARDEGRPFDVILMDMQMPVLDGYAATSLLRRKGYTGPIIALTAHAMAGDREKCLKAGCDDFAAKPIDRKRLIETVRRYVRKRGAATADSQKRPEVPVS